MTPDEAYALAFPIIWRLENGGDAISVVDNPSDPGQLTIGGVALGEYPGMSESQLRAMTYADFFAFYRANYWTPNGCDALPWPVSLVTFDGCVNQGTQGAMALQAALGVAADGSIGPITIAAANKADPIALCANTMQIREAAYRAQHDFATFGTGWIRRLFTVAFSAAAISPDNPAPIV